MFANATSGISGAEDDGDVVVVVEWGLLDRLRGDGDAHFGSDETSSSFDVEESSEATLE
jgi:hypothetical protein